MLHFHSDATPGTHIRFPGARAGGQKAARKAVRLLPGATIGGGAPPRPVEYTSLLDRPPAQQFMEMLSLAGRSGLTTSDVSSVLKVHPKHAAKIVEAVTDECHVTSRAEQHGRTKAYRYFGPGETGKASSGALVVASGGASSSAAAGGPSPSGGASSSRDLALPSSSRGTAYFEMGQRREWVLDYVKREKVIVVEMIRPILRYQQRLSTMQSDNPTSRNPEIDKKTIIRIVDGLVEEKLIQKIAVNSPFSGTKQPEPAPAGSSAHEIAAAFARAQSGTVRGSEAKKISLIALPKIKAEGPEVSGLLKVIGKHKSWDSYMFQYRLQLESTPEYKAAKQNQKKTISTDLVVQIGGREVRLIADKEGPTAKSPDRGGQSKRRRGRQPAAVTQRVGDVLGDGVGMDLLQAADGFDDAGRDLDSVGSLSMRLGYVPGNAIRAQRLHAWLVERSAALAAAASGEDAAAAAGSSSTSPPAFELSELSNDMFVPDYLMLCGLGAMPTEALQETLITEARKDVDINAIRMRELPQELLEFCFEPGPHLAKSIERLAPLIHLLEKLGLVIPHEKSTWITKLNFRLLPCPALPSKFTIASAASHRDWLDEGADTADEQLYRRFTMRLDEERAEYWEALRTICMEQLHPDGITPRATSGRAAANAANASIQSMVHDEEDDEDEDEDEGQPPLAVLPRYNSLGAEEAPSLHLPEGISPRQKGRKYGVVPSALPERSQNVLTQLRDTQWYTTRSSCRSIGYFAARLRPCRIRSKRYRRWRTSWRCTRSS